MNKITAVTANDDYSLDLKFSDGSLKRFDAKPYLDYEVFRELKDLNYFKQVDVAFGTVQWASIYLTPQRSQGMMVAFYHLTVAAHDSAAHRRSWHVRT